MKRRRVIWLVATVLLSQLCACHYAEATEKARYAILDTAVDAVACGAID